ncbi:Protein sel-1-like 1 [Hondaea fermentalgiana]|uniref:Protein sel-1-like 1 n=1 Tax=Hondaea fermentalgiana TaxID=2315210 RepID=A0A2R5GDG1_9STRA|nr:Protein sel-1-like 1 [Hondaea fermentalgiana]|eukprot:GBG29000.1 Protein sel-1-like 1 [Hondaea fermentalgiana]
MAMVAVFAVVALLPSAGKGAKELGSIEVRGCEDPGACCVLDEVQIHVRVPLPRIAGVHALWGLAIVDADTGEIMRRVLLDDDLEPDTREPQDASLVPWEEQRRLLADKLEAFEAPIPAIGYESLDAWDASLETAGAHGELWPRLVAARMPESGLYIFDFDRDTNRPPVATRDEILKVLSFSRSLGAKLRGEWISPRQLSVECLEADDKDTNELTDEHFFVEVRRYPRPRTPITALQRMELRKGRADETIVFRGTHRIRIGFASRVRFDVLVSSPDEPVAQTATYTFMDCNDPGASRAGGLDILFQRPGVAQDAGVIPSPPVFVLEEMLALHASTLKLPRLSGRTPLLHWSDDFVQTSWSLSFWLAADPRQSTESLRAILYHGMGQGHESGLRTPSLWLLPGSSRLALRVSTRERADYGHDAETLLPLGQWVHVAMIVRNDTSTGRFTISVYQNGDRVLRLDEPVASVLSGPGELYFANDAWGSSLHGLVRHLQVFDRALEHTEVLDDMDASFVPDTTSLTTFFQPKDQKQAEQALTSKDEEESCQANNDADEEADEDDLDQALTDPIADEDSEENLAEVFHRAMESAPHVDATMLAQAAAQGHEEAAFVWAARPWLQRFFPSDQVLLSQGKETPAQAMRRAVVESGSVEAKLALADKWRRARHCRAALAYYSDASARSLAEHTTRGQQPLVEMQVLHDYVEDAGEKGEDDLNIQYFIGQAEVGDTDAMVAVGNWYYWGSRGLGRDHERAFRYFERAADAGHAGAMTACGNMLLKGEGVQEKNLTAAIERYTRAAADDDQLAALNGLGYIYFFGHGDIAKNASKALEFFERNLRDGDSLYNAAHIYLHEPTLRDVEKASRYLRMAADNFESVPAAHALGQLLAVSSLTSSSCEDASHYLRKSALRGSWGRRLRQGFDAYLDGDYENSLFHYLLGGLIGYSRGAENALWLLSTPLKRLPRVPHGALFARVDRPMPPLQTLLYADLRHAEGDLEGARRAWAAASTIGDWTLQPTYRAQASYNLAMEALELGDTARASKHLDRAEAFFSALEKQSSEADGAIVALRMARWRVWARERYPGLEGWIQRLVELSDTFFGRRTA